MIKNKTEYRYGSDEEIMTDLIGETLIFASSSDDEVRFKTETGKTILFYHGQACCETVEVEDICGDLEDLIGSPIIRSELRTSYENPKHKYDESITWTFYEFATIKGSVTIRWYGESNGCYSESVDISIIDTESEDRS